MKNYKNKRNENKCKDQGKLIPKEKNFQSMLRKMTPSK